MVYDDHDEFTNNVQNLEYDEVINMLFIGRTIFTAFRRV